MTAAIICPHTSQSYQNNCGIGVICPLALHALEQRLAGKGPGMRDAPETTQSLATHLRRMADNASDQIDADRLSRAANLVEARADLHRADYEARILSALDVQPAPDVAQIRADALREAAGLVHRIAQGYHTGGDGAIGCALLLTAGNIRSLIAVQPAPDALIEDANAARSALGIPADWPLLRAVQSLEDRLEKASKPTPADTAQCCMCGQKDLSTVEDGGPECQLGDDRWVCSAACYDRAVGYAPDAPDAATLVAWLTEAEAELRTMKTAGIIEVAVRNPNVAALVEAVKPFYAAVFNDNGDVTISTGHITIKDWLRLEAALAAWEGRV